jgi:hypothetical protein
VDWVRVDLDQIGANFGTAWVPIHTDVNYSIQVYDKSKSEWIWDRRVTQMYVDDPNLLFDWEGPALVTYSEHRQVYGLPSWDEAAYGILDTMYNRVVNDKKWNWPNYVTLNDASFSSYAIPQLPEKAKGGVYEPRFKNFVALTISWYYLHSREKLPYDYMVHRAGGQTCFGYSAGDHPYCIP